MKKPEEIKRGLTHCKTGMTCECSKCPYSGYKDMIVCTSSLTKDALAYIKQLEEQVCLMKIQMHGDCGVCKHRSGCQIDGRDIAMSKTCYDCMMKESRPNWEYEGLPELPKKGATI